MFAMAKIVLITNANAGLHCFAIQAAFYNAGLLYV
jgi:hypothetical protein